MNKKSLEIEQECVVCGSTFTTRPPQSGLHLCASCYHQEKEHRDGHYLDAVIQQNDALLQQADWQEQIALSIERIANILDKALDRDYLSVTHTGGTDES